MKVKLPKYLLLIIIIICYPISLSAYVGLGAGITFLGALLAVITAILFAVGGFLAWPIKALLRRRKQNKKQPQKSDINQPNTK